MTHKELHPSVQQFKKFVRSHPKMVKKVRDGNVTWQELFEEWYLLGEEDPRWNEFREYREGENSSSQQQEKSDFIPQILHAIKRMDSNQIQGHIASLSQALGAIQGVVSQFQGNQSKGRPGNNQSQPPHPFQFRKD